MPDARGGPMPGWNGRERVHETLYMRGARASLLTGAGVLSALGCRIVRGFIMSRARGAVP